MGRQNRNWLWEERVGLCHFGGTGCRKASGCGGGKGSTFGGVYGGRERRRSENQCICLHFPMQFTEKEHTCPVLTAPLQLEES